MKRNFSRWALTLALAFTATNAFAQDEEGEPAETEEAAEDAEGEPAAEEEATEEATAEADADAEADAELTTGTFDSKFFIGLRLGYGIPLGTVDGVTDGKLSDFASGQIPIWIDLAYRVTPNILVGLYASYGFAIMGDFCDEGDCSGADIRFGLQGQYHLSPGESFNPWFGLGIGYEIFDYSLESEDGSSQEGSLKGFEFVNLQAGGDFKLSDSVGIGPFVSFSLGQYSTVGFGDQSESLDEKALHEWLTLGVRGAFSL
ncbi:MAG TPA: hypothetical protein VI072_05955 [Polyangiaceae bacterium]